MSIREILSILELGLAYSVLALGVFIPFRVLNQADLTVEGSFTFGAAVCAMLTVQGHPLLGLLLGMLAGAAAGLVTAVLQTQFGVAPILSGILTMTGLYSINLWVLGGKSNVPLMREKTLFSYFQPLIGGGWHKVAALGLLALGLLVLLNVFFRTTLGLSIRATGDNERMVRSSSVSTNLTRCVALALGNGLVGLAGGVVAQVQQFTDVMMGSGTVVVALASLIIGETIFRNTSILRGTLAAVSGSILYRLIVAWVLKTSVPAYAVKLISALVVMVAVCYPVVRKRLTLQWKRGVERRAAAGTPE